MRDLSTLSLPFVGNITPREERRVKIEKRH
jgi:hypothetical protein